MKFTHLFLLSLLACFQVYGKVRILTFHYNRPDFIEIQYKTFKKFLKDDHEIIVFSDAPTPELEEAIRVECEKYGITCIRFEQDWHYESSLITEIEQWEKMPNITGFAELGILKGRHPSVRHCHVIQYALDNYGYDHDDIVGIVDGDMFPIRPVSIREYLKDHKIIGTKKFDQTGNVEFLWVALSFFDVPNLPDVRTLQFHLSRIDRRITDSGGHSYYYLHDHPEVKHKKYQKVLLSSLRNKNIKELKQLGLNDKEIAYVRGSNYNTEFHLDYHFLHYSRSSFVNIFNSYAPETESFHQNKSNPFKNFIKSILD